MELPAMFPNGMSDGEHVMDQPYAFELQNRLRDLEVPLEDRQDRIFYFQEQIRMMTAKINGILHALRWGNPLSQKLEGADGILLPEPTLLDQELLSLELDHDYLCGERVLCGKEIEKLLEEQEEALSEWVQIQARIGFLQNSFRVGALSDSI